MLGTSVSGRVGLWVRQNSKNEVTWEMAVKEQGFAGEDTKDQGRPSEAINFASWNRSGAENVVQQRGFKSFQAPKTIRLLGTKVNPAIEGGASTLNMHHLACCGGSSQVTEHGTNMFQKGSRGTAWREPSSSLLSTYPTSNITLPTAKPLSRETLAGSSTSASSRAIYFSAMKSRLTETIAPNTEVTRAVRPTDQDR